MIVNDGINKAILGGKKSDGTDCGRCARRKKERFFCSFVWQIIIVWMSIG